MKNFFYPEFKLQDYLLLKNMNMSQARALFKFRGRMAPFGQNLKRGQSMIVCPFCENHADGQEESWGCKPINRIIDLQGDYEDVFGQTFSEREICRKSLHIQRRVQKIMKRKYGLSLP